MESETPQPGAQQDNTTASPMRLHSLYRRTYPFRTLGMGLAVLPVLVVLHERGAGAGAWAWVLFSGFAWPHVAWLRSRRGRDPYRSELSNFLVDSAIAGSMAPLMHFNLLPSVVIATVATADKINSGVRGLWSRSLLGMAAAMLAAGLLTGFRLDIASDMPVVMACLPLMVVHTLAVSASSYRLIRRVQKQNLRLDELHRHDALTGLQSRGHWQEQASALLARHAASGQAACLLLVDVDLFKHINDLHGHAAGDDVLRGIADAIRAAMPRDSHAGRLGGDEFALAMPMALAGAEHVAERIRASVHALAFPQAPGLHCSVSLGLAEPRAGEGLRAWMEAADRALYRAKAAGRNRTHAADPREAASP